MKPSSRQLIESIRWELDTRVAPEVQSDWARSSLRSIGSLLAHLAVRVELEADLLRADNADIRTLLGDLAACELDDADVGLSAGADLAEVATLTAENERLRALIDAELRRLLSGGPGSSDALERINAYLERQLGRERPLVDPAFKGPIF